MFLLTCLIVWINFLEDVTATDQCYNWYYSKTYYCEYGCCGDGWDRGCCSIAGIIVGACIGAIVLIALIITVVCCCIKHKGKPGRVIGTTTTATSVAVVGQQNYAVMQMQPASYGGQIYGQPYPTGPVAPPAYSDQYPPGPPPSAGMYNDPAYPPPTAPPSYK